jgi:hypothetical protein
MAPSRHIIVLGHQKRAKRRNRSGLLRAHGEIITAERRAGQCRCARPSSTVLIVSPSGLAARH